MTEMVVVLNLSFNNMIYKIKAHIYIYIYKLLKKVWNITF